MSRSYGLSWLSSVMVLCGNISCSWAKVDLLLGSCSRQMVAMAANSSHSPAGLYNGDRFTSKGELAVRETSLWAVPLAYQVWKRVPFSALFTMSWTDLPSRGIFAKVAISQSNTPYDLAIGSSPPGRKLERLRHCARKKFHGSHQTSEADVKMRYSSDSGAIHRMGSNMFVAV